MFHQEILRIPTKFQILNLAGIRRENSNCDFDERDIRNEEYKFDQILLANFPIYISTVIEKINDFSSFWRCTLFARFELDENEEKELIKRLTVKRASD